MKIMRLFPRVAASVLLAGLPLSFASPQTPADAPKPSVVITAPEPDVDGFLVKPYLQWGNPDKKTATKHVTLMWHTPDTDAPWTVETKRGGKWIADFAPSFQSIRLVNVDAHRVYSAELTMFGGEPTAYRVLRGGKSVFESTATPPKAPGKKTRIVVFGDCGADTDEQRKVAYQTYLAKPDYVFVTGDIVYGRGRVSEYRQKYFPVYNADVASPTTGAPLIRSTVFLSSPGNHDILHPDFDQFPDMLAYFLYWRQPLNGPITASDSPQIKPLKGTPEQKTAYLASAGANYPRMANFSYDNGDVHWTVLDANPYVDWNDPKLREWLRDDLRAAAKAKWRFVGFHQPGFHSSKEHFNEQQMRLVADLLEQGKVDLVLNGHVHNYQRSFPTRFTVAPRQLSNGKPVAGEWKLDKAFNGVTNTKPNGVIYIVTGAGGAHLYSPDQEAKPDTWQPFTDKYISTTNSFTVIDVDGKRITIKQMDVDGKVLDTFTVTK